MSPAVSFDWTFDSQILERQLARDALGAGP
jgi:hypothetical protein